MEFDSLPPLEKQAVATGKFKKVSKTIKATRWLNSSLDVDQNKPAQNTKRRESKQPSFNVNGRYSTALLESMLIGIAAILLS